MREFILWNHSLSMSFNFKDQNILIKKIDDLGISFEFERTNNVVTKYSPNFKQIEFDLIFLNVGANSYQKFSELSAFLSNNGSNQFLLQYNFNGKTLYADVWFVGLTKSQKNDFKVLEEKISFERTSLWYTLESSAIPDLPLNTAVSNAVFEEIPVDIFIQAPFDVGTNNKLTIALMKDSEVYSKIELSINDSEEINISSTNKYIEVISNLISTSGYNRTNKNYQSFMFIPKGDFSVQILQNTSNPSFVSISYKKWVYD